MISGGIRRAAIDVGSGMTKLQIGLVNGEKIQEYLCSIEVSVPFGVVFKEHGTLTPQVQQEGISTMKRFKELCHKHGVTDKTQISAIGTEVFRRADNGQSFLKIIENETGIFVRLISQEEEAMLGYLSCKAAISTKSYGKGLDIEDPVVYDSGGGSLQIMKKDGDNLKMYLKEYGTAPCYSDLMKIKGITKNFLNNTPNPCSKKDIDALVHIIKKYLVSSDTKKNKDINWLKSQEVVGIGGINSMFRMAYDFLGQRESYNLADLEQLLFETIAGKTDDELEKMYRFVDDMEAPAYVVPRMTLLYTVLLHTGIKKVHYENVIGSCPGILISPRSTILQ